MPENNKVRFVCEGLSWCCLSVFIVAIKPPQRGDLQRSSDIKFLLLVKEGKLFIQLLSLKCLQLKVSSIFRGVMFSSPAVRMYTGSYTHAYISIISKGTQFNTIWKHCTIPSTPEYLCDLDSNHSY